MTSRDEAAAMVALMRRRYRPVSQYAELVESEGSAIAVLDALEKDQDEPQLFPADTHRSDLGVIRTEIESWLEEGIRLVSVFDANYPSNLRTIWNRPPLLFYRGELLEADSNSIAVVGARKASEEGLAIASEIASGLAEAGVTVVSGLAKGIDSAAHRAALDRGGRTVAVIGTGLHHSYPRQNAGLQRQLSEEAAVVSQFFPNTPPTRKTFPMRNIVMSGFARATAVIEATGESGAKMQAERALDHGRPVFLLSSLLTHEWAQAHARLPGTFVVDSAQEILDRIDGMDVPDEALSLA